MMLKRAGEKIDLEEELKKGEDCIGRSTSFSRKERKNQRKSKSEI